MTQTYGIKVSEPGFDVNSASDENLSLKSGMTLLKVFDTSTVALSAGFTEVTHNLGYVPQFLVFVKDTALTPDGVYLATADQGIAVARADTTKLYIKQNSATQTEALYYIFYEPTDTGTAPSVVSTNKYGIKVSVDGVNVRDANILQQTFNSEKNSLKIASDGEVTSTASGTRTVSEAHGLSVVPGYFAFYEVSNDGNWYPMFTESDITAARVVVWTDATNINFEITTTSNQTVKVKYFILIDPGE